jgi:inner membrane protein
MDWWGWVIVGAVLLGAELAFVDAQFYLVFIGAAAILVGLLGMGGLALAPWLQWTAFAAFALLSLATFRRALYAKLRANTPALAIGPAGESVTVPQELAPGASCRLEYRGSTWTAVNSGQQPIAAGGRARIDRVDGLTLILREQ